MSLQIQKYEEFIGKLQTDLQKLVASRDEIYTTQAEYVKLETQLSLIHGKTKTKVNIGCDFFMDAVMYINTQVVQIPLK